MSMYLPPFKSTVSPYSICSNSSHDVFVMLMLQTYLVIEEAVLAKERFSSSS